MFFGECESIRGGKIKTERRTYSSISILTGTHRLRFVPMCVPRDKCSLSTHSRCATQNTQPARQAHHLLSEIMRGFGCEKREFVFRVSESFSRPPWWKEDTRARTYTHKHTQPRTQTPLDERIHARFFLIPCFAPFSHQPTTAWIIVSCACVFVWSTFFLLLLLLKSACA